MRKRLLSDILLLIALLACVAVLAWALKSEYKYSVKDCRGQETIGETMVIGERICTDGGTDEREEQDKNRRF